MRLGDVRHQSEPQSRPGDQVALMRTHPVELLKDALLLVERDPEAAVGDLNDGVAVARGEAQIDLAGVPRVFHGVGQEIQNGLLHGVRIGPKRGHVLLNVKMKGEALLHQWVLHRADRRIRHIHQAGGTQAVDLLALLDLGEVEYVVHQPGEAFALIDDGLQVLCARLLIARAAQRQGFGEHPDGRQRGLQLVRYVGDELGAHFGEAYVAVDVPQEQIAAEHRDPRE